VRICGCTVGQGKEHSNDSHSALISLTLIHLSLGWLSWEIGRERPEREERAEKKAGDALVVMELHLSPIGRNASKEVTDVLFAHLWTVIELDSMRKLCRCGSAIAPIRTKGSPKQCDTCDWV